MNIIDALKNLGAKVLGVEANTIPGDDKCEVIDYIAKQYTPPTEPSAGGSMTGEAQAIEAITTPESAEAATIANKVNEIITQLKARGVTK